MNAWGGYDGPALLWSTAAVDGVDGAHPLKSEITAD